ncbi:tripartite tricarboxylate transporter TctB family protein [Alkalibacter sp. M17DMB]|nr:tripartite tricarboxylate transporter TctB family protein [Alkalibacter mobilis]MBF7096631.1 tripartite tricarboxylate transporter TctB family protein [Alkalibacter mobilis]
MLFPKIVLGILAILAVTIGIQEFKKKKECKAKDKECFFMEGFDKLKLFGTLALFIGYIFAMEWFSFLPASIVFMMLFNLLYAGWHSKKSIIVSAIISIVTPTLVWYIFGIVFNITLP